MGTEIYSGRKNTEESNYYYVFEPLYGAGHSFGGYMDYFTNVNLATNGAGLINPYLKHNIQISELCNISIDNHLFFSTNVINISQNNLKRYLAYETDISIIYSLNEYTKCHFGYSFLTAGESLIKINESNSRKFAQWSYIMISYKPQFK